MSNTANIHLPYIKRCFELALSAAHGGNHPFGAVLALDGKIVLTAENTIHSENDITRHAEMNLISMAVKKLGPLELKRAILYTSTEPCAMCAGALYWSKIGRLVFGCSVERLMEITGGGLNMSSRSLLNCGSHQVEIIGPVEEEIGADIHRKFWKNG
jgi:tRNA(Arg) A34 adenosine deaminase TadA